MNENHINDFIGKIEMLERRVGANTTYISLEPNEIILSDLFSLQRAAKTIAVFVGLPHLNFLVTPANLSGSTAAHIELSHSGNDVYIEISNDQLNYPEAVLATLAHEISHKYLHYHNINIGGELSHKYENEILTDLTAVFLGLGKLMLNGCHVEEVNTSHTYEGTRTTTTTRSTGYLERDQLAFIYLFINAMRRIPGDEYRKNLRSDVKELMRNIYAEHAAYFNWGYHEDTYLDDQLTKFRKIIKQHQKILFSLDASLSELKELIHNQGDKYVKKKHQDLHESFKLVNNLLKINTYNPCEQFINRVRAELVISDQLKVISEKFKSETNREKIFHKTLKRAQKLNPGKIDSSSSQRKSMSCPIDGTDLQSLGETSEFEICPTCHYEISIPQKGTFPKRSRFKTWLKKLRR